MRVGFGQGFIAACALAKGVVDPTPFRVTTSATAATSKSSSPASPTPASLDDKGLSRSASATAAASAAVLEDVRRPAATREDGADTKEGFPKTKKKKRRRTSVEISPGDGTAGVSGDGSESGGAGGSVCDDGSVSATPASSEDTKNKGGSGGKDSGGVVVADPCSSDVERASQDGIKRSKKKGKKRRRAGANAGKDAAQAEGAAAAATEELETKTRNARDGIAVVQVTHGVVT